MSTEEWIQGLCLEKRRKNSPIEKRKKKIRIYLDMEHFYRRAWAEKQRDEIVSAK